MSVIAHNLFAINTNRQLNITAKNKEKAVEKLSSGYCINRAADNAAGLTISEKMRSQIRGLNQASKNIQDAISLCQVADGALNETHEILQRMRELSVQAANDTNQEIDRAAIQSEIDELRNEVVRISESTTFNAKPVFEKDLIANNISNITTPINNSSIQIPQGIEITVNSANISTELSRNADGSFELEDGVVYTISSDVKNVSFHLSSGSTVSIKNSNLEMCGIICDNAKLFLSDVTINNEDSSGMQPSGWDGAPISCKGSTEINFIGTNSLTGGRYTDALGYVKDYTAIEVLSGESVELNGNGQLNCIGGDCAAGVGANYITNEIDAGKIVVNSGSIYAYSGGTGLAAGIGGAYEGNGGNVVINGGYVYANGGGGGAGIGSGVIVSGSTYTDGGIVEINGGIVYAESIGSEDGAAGIGGGYGSNGADVIITGGDVTAIGGDGGAGIGSGMNLDFKDMNSGSVSISGGKVIAVGSTGRMQPGYDENVPQGSAVGQGAMFGNKTTMQYWENGFGTTIIDGAVVDTKTIGRDLGSLADGNYSFIYNNNPVEHTQENVVQGNWWIQMGANAGNGIFIKMGSLEEMKQKIENINVLSHQTAEAAIESVEIAINLVSKQRTMIGAQQNRLECAKAVDKITSENTQYAESRIRDTDMASEMVEYSTRYILEQFGQSMLTQANQINQNVLSLLE